VGLLGAALWLILSNLALATPNRRPIADAGGVYQINEGEALALDGSRSSDPDNDPLTYAWDLDDDGQFADATGATPTVPWATLLNLGLPSDGSWLPVALRVNDGRGGVDTDYTWLAISNVAPQVTHGGPYEIDEGQDLALAGTATDAGGDPLTVGWDLDNDDTYDDATGAAPTVSWATLAALGLASDGSDLPIGLQADDGQGGTNRAVTTLTINNLPPVAEAGGPYQVAIGSDLVLAGSATDPGGDTLSYEWDIDNDGQYDDATGATPTIAAAYLAAAGLTISNSITIHLKVTDSEGASHTNSALVRASNEPPVAKAGGPYAIDEGADLDLDASGSSDLNGDALTCAWDLDNDGQFDDATGATPTVPWATLLNLGLASDGSSLTIQVRVEDIFGASSTDSATLTIANLDPVAEAGGPYTADHGASVTLAGSATDAGGDTLSYAWDLDGDGQYDDATGATPTVPGVILRGLGAGEHTIGLQVQDGQGGTNTATAALTIGAAPTAGYVAGDFHQHSTFTDGSYSFNKVMAANKRFGLDWWANSEHGGRFNRDGRTSGLDTGVTAYWDQDPSVTILGNNLTVSGGHTNMWRWQSLRDYSWPTLLAARSTYADRVIIQGLEWNPPGATPPGAGGLYHEHCSMACIANQFGASPNANPVAQFEYQFDAYDNDTSGANGLGWTKSPFANSDDAKLLQAAQWLAANYGMQSWLIPAHPERKKCWTVQTFRMLNDAAPTVAFGFESMPGHQKSSQRGEYSSSSAGGGTYGGCGIYAAKVGGLWDAMLGEGRAWWLFASSDFHSDLGADFWPGEYQKTYTYVTNRADPQAIVNGLRSGNSWVVMGDLIDALEFDVDGVPMGGTRTFAPASVTVTIRVHDPEGWNWGPEGHNTPVLDHVDVIAGEYSAKIPTNSPAYTNDVNPTARVIARFGAVASGPDANGISTTAWTDEGNGWKRMTLSVNVEGKKKYLRLRGTNRAVNDGETDAAGNPVLDVPGQNTPEKAWDDLWFYSNPIFIDPTTVSLTVTSDHGTATPAVGTNLFAAGTPITASVTSPDVQGTTRYVCNGWTGTGSVPASGSSNSVEFTLNEDSTLTWTWRTQYWLDTGVNNSGGSVNVDDSWQDAGASITVTATAVSGFTFAGWTGTIVSANNPLVVAMSQAQAITAVFVPTITYVDDDYSTTNAGGHVYGDNAFNSLQAAVNAVQAGGTVYVQDGVYDTGSTEVNGMACRVALTKAVTLRSVNGPSGAIILGQADPATTNGPQAVRCAYVGTGASLIGFTLSDGHTQARPAGGYEPWWIPLMYGGGLFAEAGAMVSDCIIEDCTAAGAGGGVYLQGPGTTLRNCQVTHNRAEGGGGGLCAMDNTVVESCTLADNVSAFRAGGLWANKATVRNSIVWGNVAPLDANYYRNAGTFLAVCATPLASGTGNIASDPQFVSTENGNYGLAGTSPCIDAGSNQTWMADAKDLFGEVRSQDGDGNGSAIVDLGAIEFGTAPKVAIVANGFNAPLSVPAGQRVQLLATANRGQDVGQKDWWILAATDFGWYYYDLATGWQPGIQVSYQGPFMSLGMTPLMDTTGLPAGNYWFYFGVDNRKDGVLQIDTLNYDAVAVTVY